MRQAIEDFQDKLDADLLSIEACILNYLHQAEQIFSDKASSKPEVRLKIAIACKKGLEDFRQMRNSLLAKRRLVEDILPN